MFVETLSHTSGSAPGHAWSAPVSLALHVLALLGAVGASLWSVGQPPEPEIPVVYIVSAPPPSGSRGDAGSPPQAPAAHRPPAVPRVVPAEPVALRQIPVETPFSSTSVELPASSGAEPDATGVGDRPGVPGGIDGPGTGDGPSAVVSEPGKVFLPGGDVRRPELLRRVDPDYPEAARKARLEGVVVLQAIITANGVVEEVRVVKSAGSLLDSAAEEAVHRWKYRPATLHGRAVRVALTVTVSFRLH